MQFTWDEMKWERMLQGRLQSSFTWFTYWESFLPAATLLLVLPDKLRMDRSLRDIVEPAMGKALCKT